MTEDHRALIEHPEHCDCYRQSRLSNANWVREYRELLKRVAAAEEKLAAARVALMAAVELCDDKDPSDFGPRYCDCHGQLAALAASPSPCASCGQDRAGGHNFGCPDGGAP